MAAFSWVLVGEDGRELRAVDDFQSQASAEAWLGDHWRELLDEGAESVSLRNGGDEVYAMGLGEE